MQDIFQYGWMGYGYLASVAIFALIWAIVPAHLAVRLIKPQGRQHTVIFWSTYMVGFLLILGGLTVALTRYFFSATF